jgi:hypothetical protein
MGLMGSWGELEVVQGVQVCHRATWFHRGASPTGASASSFVSSPYKQLAPGRWGGACVRPIGRGRGWLADEPFTKENASSQVDIQGLVELQTLGSS